MSSYVKQNLQGAKKELFITFIIEYEYNKDIHAFIFILSNKLYFS